MIRPRTCTFARVVSSFTSICSCPRGSRTGSVRMLARRALSRYTGHGGARRCIVIHAPRWPWTAGSKLYIYIYIGLTRSTLSTPDPRLVVSGLAFARDSFTPKLSCTSPSVGLTRDIRSLQSFLALVHDPSIARCICIAHAIAILSNV